MKTKVDREKLRRLVDIVDAAEAVISTLPKGDDPYEAIKAARRVAVSTLNTLQNEHGATFNATAFGGYFLRAGGVASSCTVGEAALLRNWRKAALRRLAQETGA